MYGKQMELFEDGGEVDEVSGNNIPLGSTAEEVRDDQPAMLSEGEMVIPADVVRYFGVEHFMNMRDQAKIGYKKMEAMGQFGTDEGQTLPDDALFNAGGPPFTIEDIEIIEGEIEDEDVPEDEMEAKSGALVKNYAEGGDTIDKDSLAKTLGTPLLPDAGRKPELKDPQGLGQLVGSTGIGEFQTKFYMDKTGQIHQIFAMKGLPSDQVQEDWIEIDSPFELRSYRELGGGATTESTTPAQTQYSDPGGPNPNDPVGSGFNTSFNSLSDWGKALNLEISTVLGSLTGSYGDFGNMGDPNNPNASPNVDVQTQVDTFSDASGGGTSGSSTGDAAADTGASGPDGGVSDDGSASPGDFKHGGFVHKRKSKKKKARRGLAGR